MKKTRWFPGNIDPVWVGWYDTRLRLNGILEKPIRRHWNGVGWSLNFFGSRHCFLSCDSWRGLTKPTKEKA